MYTTRNFHPYSSKLELLKSKSSDNFYKMATERSLKHVPTAPSSDKDCLACKHESQRITIPSVRQGLQNHNVYTSRQNIREDYYKSGPKDELAQLRKTKRYLEELLERSKEEHRKSIETYENRVALLTQQIEQKDAALFELQRAQNHKEAQQYYLASASLVQTYRQQQKQDPAEDTKARRIRELLNKNEMLQQELAETQKIASERMAKLEELELQLVRMGQLEECARQYEAMRLLIDKMEEEKLQLLDRQHEKMQQIEANFHKEREAHEGKATELRTMLMEKSRQLGETEAQLHQTRQSLQATKDEQYEALRELLDERDKECLALQSRLNCIQSQLNFIKGRYGYVLRIAYSNHLLQSQYNQQEEFALERVGRHQLSNGKESLLGMNLSPIKHR